MVIVIQLGVRTDRKVRVSRVSDAGLTGRHHQPTWHGSVPCVNGEIPREEGQGQRGAQINSLMTM